MRDLSAPETACRTREPGEPRSPTEVARVPPRSARIARTALLTVGAAFWSAHVIGIDDLIVLALVTFSWTALTILRLTTEERQPQAARSWAELSLPMAGGVVISVLLPAWRGAQPNWWLWDPVAVPEPLVVPAAILLVAWPLRPFCWRRRRAEALSCPRDLDTLVLSACLFILSQSLVPALGGAVALSYRCFLNLWPVHAVSYGLGAPAGSHAMPRG